MSYKSKDKIISEGTLQSIRKGKSITTDSIASLCAVLDCQPGDLMEYIPDTEKQQVSGTHNPN